jgi:integrase
MLLLAYWGLRWGDAIGLRVRDVEFLRRRITVSENAVQIGAHHAVGPTKGRKARSVPVPVFVLDEPSVRCERNAPCGRDGGYLPRPKSSNGSFTRTVKTAGIPAVTPHDPRHTCASLAVSAGVNVLALQRMLGHTSAKMTTTIWTQLRSRSMPGIRPKMWAKCGHRAGSMVHSRPKIAPTCADAVVASVRAEGFEPLFGYLIAGPETL